MRANINPYDYQQLRMTMTNTEIAVRYHIRLDSLYKWCKRNGVTSARITDYEVKEGLKNKTVKELAAEYNVPPSTIYGRAWTLGISIKQSSLFDKSAIQDLRQSGYSYKEIAAAMGYNYKSMIQTLYRQRKAQED